MINDTRKTHNDTLDIDVEWDKDDDCYEENRPTKFSLKESELGLDNEEYSSDNLKDVLQEYFWGHYCDTQDIWCNGEML